MTRSRALITGAGAKDGIGFACARLLAEAGFAFALSATTDRVHGDCLPVRHGQDRRRFRSPIEHDGSSSGLTRSGLDDRNIIDRQTETIVQAFERSPRIDSG